MKDWMPFAISMLIFVAVIGATLWLLDRSDKEKRAECREAGGVVLPSGWGWDCHVPSPTEKKGDGEP